MHISNSVAGCLHLAQVNVAPSAGHKVPLPLFPHKHTVQHMAWFQIAHDGRWKKSPKKSVLKKRSSYYHLSHYIYKYISFRDKLNVIVFDIFESSELYRCKIKIKLTDVALTVYYE